MAKHPFYKSLYFSAKGSIWMLRNERNFQIEIFGLLINLVLIVILKLNTLDAALILISCGSILVAEILNTALEKLCDYTQPDFEPKIGLVKDIAAGAVLCATIFAVIIGVLIYWPYLERIIFPTTL